MNLILILTFIHFLLGLSIQSKTSLIVEYAKANNCTGALFKQYDSVAKMELVYTNPAADSKACAEIHKLIAEKFAFQTLQGSKLYQLFNYHKMFLSDHDTIAIGTYIILAIPFLLFSCGFYIIFTVWSFMFKNKTLINHRTKIKWAAFTLFYLANILIIYMWVDGVRNACEMDGFIFKLHPPQNLFPFLHYFFR